MYREDRLVIRLSDAERAAIERLAQVERLPASTLARRMLLHEADRRGLGLPVDFITDATAETEQGS
jgi:hypothetical protein